MRITRTFTEVKSNEKWLPTRMSYEYWAENLNSWNTAVRIVEKTLDTATYTTTERTIKETTR